MSLLSEVIESAVSAALNDGLRVRGRPAYVTFAVVPFLIWFGIYLYA